MRSIVSDAENASTMELVEAAGSIAAELAGRDAPEPGMAALELAEALGGAMDVMEAALARLVKRVDDTGVFGELGFSSTGAWLRTRLGMRDGRAAERVRLARQLPRLAEVGKRLADGSLSAGYAGAIADAVARLDDIDAELGERLLLGLVEQGHTAGQVAKDGAQITDLINQHRGKEKEPEDAKRGFSRSWLTKAKSLDGGMWVKGWLTPEHAAAFDQIIGPLAKPKAKGDDRDLGQRTADALMSVISEGNKNASVIVIIDLAAFTEATGDTGPFDFTTRTGDDGMWGDPSDQEPGAAAAPDDPAEDAPDDVIRGPDDERRRGPGPPPGGPDDAVHWPGPSRRRRTPQQLDDTADDDTADDGGTGAGRGHENRPAPERVRDHGRSRVAARLLDGTPISSGRARQIALNAGINALVLGRSGQPIYLGRTVRFATPAQRKVLLALYETCCVDGCRIPAHYCEIHHLDGGWKLATPTDIDKLAPTCGWHNRWVETHADQVEQRRDDQGRVTLRILPPWERRTIRTS